LAGEKKPKRKQYRALVGLTFADDTRVEAGELIPDRLLDVIPESWYDRKVEEV
jgi:hypothetical protein